MKNIKFSLNSFIHFASMTYVTTSQMRNDCCKFLYFWSKTKQKAEIKKNHYPLAALMWQELKLLHIYANVEYVFHISTIYYKKEDSTTLM